ncbi:MAG: hypothetical protein RLZZ264_581 [Bacillota bacterium]
MFNNFIKYLTYSGSSIIITLNPLHWRVIPYFRRSNELGREKTRVLSWAFLTITFWLDDGSW